MALFTLWLSLMFMKISTKVSHTGCQSIISNILHTTFVQSSHKIIDWTISSQRTNLLMQLLYCWCFGWSALHSLSVITQSRCSISWQIIACASSACLCSFVLIICSRAEEIIRSFFQHLNLGKLFNQSSIEPIDSCPHILSTFETVEDTV